MGFQSNWNSMLGSLTSVFRTAHILSAKEALDKSKTPEQPEQVEATIGGPNEDERAVIPGHNWTYGNYEEPIDADYRILSDQDDAMVLRAKKSLLKYNKAKQLGRPKGGNVNV